MKKKYIVVTVMFLLVHVAFITFMKVSSTPKDDKKTIAKISENKPVKAVKVKSNKIVKESKNKPKKAKKEKKKARLNLTEKEKYLIAKLAFAEAGNQDTKGKALVMLVVLNRVKDEQFPDTVTDVIYQKRQFSPVSSKKWNSFKPDEDCYAALELIESGFDESGGALYFESRSKSTWHRKNLNFLFKHQDHYFYK